MRHTTPPHGGQALQMPESQGQLSSSQIGGWGCVWGGRLLELSVGSAAHPWLAAPPPQGSRRVTCAHSLVLRPRGLPGADLTPTDCLTSRVMMQQSRDAHTAQWAEGWWRPSGHSWNLCANAGKGGCFAPPCGASSLPLSTSENQRSSGWLLLQAANAFRHHHKQTLHLPGRGPLLALPGPLSHTHTHTHTHTHYLGKLTCRGSVLPPQNSYCLPLAQERAGSPGTHSSPELTLHQDLTDRAAPGRQSYNHILCKNRSEGTWRGGSSTVPPQDPRAGQGDSGDCDLGPRPPTEHWGKQVSELGGEVMD